MFQKLKKMIKKFFKIKNVNKNPKDIPLLRKTCFESQNLEEYFWKSSQFGNDNRKFSVNELLPNIRLIVDQFAIKTAVEFGTAQCRVSAALLLGGVERLESVDIVKDEVVDHFENLCKKENKQFNFRLNDSAKYKVEDADLLFIDSLHNRDHLKKELENASNVNNLIMLHDTETYKTIGDQGDGMWDEVETFLKNNTEWSILYHFVHNNGLTVLKKNYR
tara:strand:- start:285 stop:941 length:657 start_codon:yes stop_codon:yes gene_type:complete